MGTDDVILQNLRCHEPGNQRGVGFEEKWEPWGKGRATPSLTCDFTAASVKPLGCVFKQSVGLCLDLSNDGYSLGPRKAGAIRLKAFPPRPLGMARPGSWLKPVRPACLDSAWS